MSRTLYLQKHYQEQMNEFPSIYCCVTSTSNAKGGFQHKHKSKEIWKDQELIYKISLFFWSFKEKNNFKFPPLTHINLDHFQFC